MMLGSGTGVAWGCVVSIVGTVRGVRAGSGMGLCGMD